MWTIRLLSLSLLLPLIFFIMYDLICAQDSIDLRELAVEELEYTRGIYLKELPLHESPVPISVYRKDFLERFGFRTVRDFLDYMPSYYLVPGIGERAITYRGFRSATSSSVLLLEEEAKLVTPDYESIPIDRAFSLKEISRVELFHGAGGSLFGAGAFSGVISLERELIPGERRIDLSLGSENLRGLSGSLHGQSHYLHIRTYEEGSPLKNYGKTYETPQANALIFKYFWNTGDISFYHFKEKTRYILTTEGKSVDQSIYSYVKDLNSVDFYNLNLRKVYTVSNYKFVFNPYFIKTKSETPFFTRFSYLPAYTVRISPIKVGFNLYCLGPFFGGDFLGGGELQYRRFKDYQLTFYLPAKSGNFRLSHQFRDDEDLLYAIFISYAYYLGKVGLHFGTRLEKHEDHAGVFAHRIGISYRIRPNHSLLFSYTEGYNTPSHFHSEPTSIVYGGINLYNFSKLDLERERTFQLSYLYQRGPQVYLRNTLFLQEQRDRIWHDPQRRGEINLSPYQVWGFESEFLGRFREHLLFANFSLFRVAEGKDIPFIFDGKYLIGIPRYMLKGGVSFRLPVAGEAYLSPLVRIIGPARNKDGRWISGYAVTDINLLIRPWKSLEVNLRVDNLFDKTYYRAGTVSAIPFGERRVSLDLTFRF